MICSVESCHAPAKCKGLCNAHHLRWWKTGDVGPAKTGRAFYEIPERLARYSEPGPDGCLLWTGALNHAGYGRIQIGGRARPAHRVAWEQANGHPFPEGMQADHLCNRPACVNPEHIEPVTAQENTRRRDLRRAA